MGETARIGPPQLDHVGVVGRDLGPLMRDFERLGFRLTEPRALMGRDPQSGELRKLGQSSCHAVFAQGYLELSAVETDDPGHHLAAWLSRGPGLRILALGDTDLASRHAGCRDAGLHPGRVSLAARDIRYGSKHGEARFEWFMLDAEHSPEGLVCFVHNLTPQLVFQPEVQQHPNGALALSGVTLRVDDLPAWTDRYQRLLGVAPATGPGSRRFHLPAGQWIEIAVADRTAHAAAAGPQSGLAGLAVKVASLAVARAWLDQQGVPCEVGDRRIRIAPELASGCQVDLVSD